MGERLAHIEHAVRELESRRSQLTAGAAELIACLNDLFERTRVNLDREWAELETLSDPAVREERLVDLCDQGLLVVQDLAKSVVPVVAGADSRLVPVELEYAIRDAVEAVPQTDPSASPQIPVLYATNAYNYGIDEMDHPTRKYLSRLQLLPREIARKTVPPKFLFFGLPTTEKDSAFLHSVLLGHEIGHAWDWRQGTTVGIMESLPKAENQTDATRLKLVGNWVQELVADAFSCLQLGPAAIFALLELATVPGKVNDLLTHPKPARRINLMLRLLDEDPSRFELSRSGGPAEDVFRVARKQVALAWKDPIKGDGLDRMQSRRHALTQVVGLLPEIIKTCRSAYTASAQPTFGQAEWGYAADAAEALSHGLPYGDKLIPGKLRSDPVPVPVILNGAMRVKLVGLTELGREIAVDLEKDRGITATQRVSEVLDLLTLKSLEIARVPTKPTRR